MLSQVCVGSAGSGVGGRESVFLEHDVVPEVYEIDPLMGWQAQGRTQALGTLPPLTHST